MSVKIAVLGCGHGGQALCAHFTQQGMDVVLFADAKHPGGLLEIQKNGGIECKGELNGFYKLKHTTTKIENAIKNSKYIFISLPVQAHESIFLEMLPYLNESQMIFNLSGHFSGIYQYKLLNKLNFKKKPMIADITSFPYVCRSYKPGIANIYAIKKKMGIASVNKFIAQEMITCINPIFPSKLKLLNDFFEAGLYDPSGVTHPPTVLFNAARISNKCEFYFYKDGICKETANFLEKIDDDRVKIGKIMGYSLPKYHEVMNSYYNLKCKNIFNFFKNSKIHNKCKFTPENLNSRYMSEDVPYSLVPWFSLGLSVGFESRIMKNLIEISSIINRIDYLKTGRFITNNIFVNLKKTA